MTPARRALLAAMAALPACASTAPPPGMPAGPLPAPVVRVGDRWRYRLVDRFRDAWLDEPTWEVVEAGAGVRLAMSSRRGGPPSEERYADAWSVLEESIYGQRHVFEAPVPLLPSPLEAGRSVRTTTAWTEPGATRRRRWSQQLSVRGWESVTVPAGRFDCLRVDRIIAFDALDGFRLHSSRTDVLWYSPQVNRWVQRELRGDYTSAGGSAANPAEGERGLEDALRWQLTEYLPAAAAR